MDVRAGAAWGESGIELRKMLWLAGLMGVLVVGTVSFLDLSPTETEDDAAQSGIDEFFAEHPFGRLFLEEDAELLANNAPQDAQVPDFSTATVSPVTAILEIADFDAADDDLLLVWDDSAGEEPDLRLAASETDPEILELLIGDVVMARVPAASGLTTDHVALLPQSAAQALGWFDDDHGNAA